MQSETEALESLHVAILEIIRAQSALNMDPGPVAEEWKSHSIDHLIEAIHKIESARAFLAQAMEDRFLEGIRRQYESA